MELYQLRTFVIVAEEENLTRAAKRLYMTPPSVSAHVKALEEELNVQLFERTPKGMEITEQGKLLKVKAEQTLRAAQDLVNHATKMQQFLMGQVSIGLNATANFLRVPQLINRVRENCPGIELSFTASASGKIIDALQDGTLDIGYIFGPSPAPEMTTQQLTSAQLVIAAPKQWEPQVSRAQWEDIAAMPWISSPYYCPFQTIADELFDQHNLSLHQVVQSGDEETKSQLVSAGVGLALLEKSEAEQAVEAERIVIWQTDPIWCDLSLAYATDKQEHPLIQAVAAAVEGVWLDTQDV